MAGAHAPGARLTEAPRRTVHHQLQPGAGCTSSRVNTPMEQPASKPDRKRLAISQARNRRLIFGMLIRAGTEIHGSGMAS